MYQEENDIKDVTSGKQNKNNVKDVTRWNRQERETCNKRCIKNVTKNDKQDIKHITRLDVTRQKTT